MAAKGNFEHFSTNSDNEKPLFLRLPHHTRRLWGYSRGRLIEIATKKMCTPEVILHSICEIIIHSRIMHQSELKPSVLSQFLSENNTPDTLDQFAKIASYALEVEFLFQKNIYYLKKLTNQTLTLSSQQIRCLLALQFFCCFPKQEKNVDLPRDYTYARIFCQSHADPGSQIAKIVCALNYFKRSEVNANSELVFARRYLEHFPDWPSETKELCKLTIISEKNFIEEHRDKLMVDFANKYIGGGVLGTGCVQEEIMFHKHVEPIVALLFTEKLEDHEALFIIGSQRFNKTDGYKSEFRFVSNFVEDSMMSDKSYIVAIDALDFVRSQADQYSQGCIYREVNKAYVGFTGVELEVYIRDIISGGWGTGAFGGNKKLKFILQWLASSAAGRGLWYLLWDQEEIHDFLKFVDGVKGCTIGRLFNATLCAGNSDNLFENILSAIALN